MPSVSGETQKNQDIRAAVHEWYRNCIGTPDPIHGSPLHYEPRSAWGCEYCQSVLIGVKSGELYRVRAQGSIESLDLPDPRNGIQRVFGCANPDCSGKRDHGVVPIAVVADRANRVHVLREGKHQLDLGYDLKEGEGIIFLKLLTSPGPKPRRWCFAATNGKRIILRPLDGQGEQIPIKTPVDAWWIRREGRGSEPDQNKWLLISNYGHATSARFSWKSGRPSVAFSRIGRLRTPPLIAVTDRRFDHVRSIIYGSERGLRAAMIDQDGFRLERTLMANRRIHYARILSIFDTPFIVACGPDGQIWSRRWDHPEDTFEGPWTAWPPLPSDVLFMEVETREKHDREASALCVLRNHQVYRVPLHNLTLVREELRDNRHRIDAPYAGSPTRRQREANDPACYARVSISDGPFDRDELTDLARSGGQKTLLRIAKRLSEYPHPSCQDAKAVSAAVLLEGMHFGNEFTRELAKRSHRHLISLLRDADPEETGHGALRDWGVFLKKHFVLAHTFSQKNIRLADLVRSNLDRETPDAFVYASRLKHQGYDVLWEETIHSPVMQGDEILRDGEHLVGLSFANGEVRELKLDADSQRLEHAQSWHLCKNHSAAPFGSNYSRVLRGVVDSESRHRWLVAPRNAIEVPETPDLAYPRWADSYAQVYAMSDRGPHDYILGLRNLDHPLAEWTPGQAAKLHDVAFGTAVHARNALAGGERRVWCIEDVGERDTFALGAEDGFLRIVVVADGRPQLLSRGSQFLGSCVRCLTTVAIRTDGGERRLLFAGTESGELFGFEVMGSGTQVELQLKFRDLLPAGVVQLFTMEIDEGKLDVCALTHDAHLITFSIPQHQQDSYLGKREHAYKLADGATEAIPLGGGRLLLAAWNPKAERGALRLMSLRNAAGQAFSSAPIPRATRDRALTAAAVMAPDPVRAADLLASIPLDDPSLRCALAEDRLDFEDDRLGRLGEESVHAYPGDASEVKALLANAVSSKLDGVEAPARLRSLHRVFIEPTESDAHQELMRNPAFQITIIRSLLTSRVLELWHDAPELESGDGLSRWIQRHLLNRSRAVQIATLRALSESLLSIVRRGGEVGERRARLLPGPDPVVSARWLLDSLQRFLFVHPSTRFGSECDASTWAAVSVLVNLLRLLPDASLTIFDHISISRVDPLVFSVLRRRLTSTRDRPISERVQLYIPWDGRDPTKHEVDTHTGQFLDPHLPTRLEIRPGDPDEAYLQAFVTCYRLIHHMAAVTTPVEVQNLAARIREVELPPAPTWALELSEGRESFFQYTMSWIVENLCPVLEQLADDQAAACEHLRSLSATLRGEEHEPGEQTLPSSLFAPELGILRTILDHWTSILEPHLAMGFYPGVEPGKPVYSGKLLFEVKANPDHLVKLTVSPSAKLSAALADIWTELKVLRGDRDEAPNLVPIERVIAHPMVPTVIMRRIPGKNLHEAEEFHPESGRSKSERLELAFLCALDIANVLLLLTQASAYHGDVSPSNIVWSRPDGGPGRFWLVDLNRVGSAKHPTTYGQTTELTRYPHLAGRLRGGIIRSLGERATVSRQQAFDVAALFQTCIWMVEGWDREMLSQGAAMSQITNGPSQVLDWWNRMRLLWHQPRDFEWTAEAFRDLASGQGRAAYVAGVTEDTECLRSALGRQLKEELWVVQGRLPRDGSPIMGRIAEGLRRSGTLVLLLGREPGATPAPEQIPDYVRSECRRFENWPDGAEPTYVQVEFVMAQRMGCHIFCYDVRDSATGEPVDPRQQAFLHHVGKHYATKPVTSEDALIRQVLADLQTLRVHPGSR